MSDYQPDDLVAMMLTECLDTIEDFNRRARRGEDLSTPPEELPLAAKVNEKKKARGEQIDIVDYCNEIGLSDDDAEWFWLKMNENDWTVGAGKQKQQVKDWRARVRQWKLMNIFPSQKNGATAAPAGPSRCIL